MEVEKTKHEMKKLEAEKVAREIEKEIEKIEEELVELAIYIDKENRETLFYVNKELVTKLHTSNSDDIYYDIIEYIQYETIDLYKYKILKILEKYDNGAGAYVDEEDLAYIEFYTNLKLEEKSFETDTCDVKIEEDEDEEYTKIVVMLDFAESKSFVNFEEYIFYIHKSIVESIIEDLKYHDDIKSRIEQLVKQEAKDKKEYEYHEQGNTRVYKINSVSIVFKVIKYLSYYKYELSIYTNNKLLEKYKLKGVLFHSLENYVYQLLEDLTSN